MSNLCYVNICWHFYFLSIYLVLVRVSIFSALVFIFKRFYHLLFSNANKQPEQKGERRREKGRKTHHQTNKPTKKPNGNDAYAFRQIEIVKYVCVSLSVCPRLSLFIYLILPTFACTRSCVHIEKCVYFVFKLPCQFQCFLYNKGKHFRIIILCAQQEKNKY